MYSYFLLLLALALTTLISADQPWDKPWYPDPTPWWPEPAFGPEWPTGAPYLARGRRCGPHRSHKTCYHADECCSVNGICGTSFQHCGKHCQPDYGHCPNRPSKESPSKEPTWPPGGRLAVDVLPAKPEPSRTMGHLADYLAKPEPTIPPDHFVHADPPTPAWSPDEFYDADSPTPPWLADPFEQPYSPTRASLADRVEQPGTPIKRGSGAVCGVDHRGRSCGPSECCSKDGRCGVGSGFCTAPDCQTRFGMCDAKKTPQGLDLSHDPRPNKSPAEYGTMITKCTKAGTIALTFDDGPNEHTEQILDLLDKKGAKATFFLAGITNDKGQIDLTPKWIQAIKRLAMNGHQIGSHTWAHPSLDSIGKEARQVEMYKNERAITNILGSYPAYMRPPYSQCSTDGPTSCLQDMAELGYHVVSFDVDTRDTEYGSDWDLLKEGVDKAFAGKTPDDNMLIIQHEHTPWAYNLTEYIIDKAHDLNWKVDTVGNCLQDDHSNWMRIPSRLSLNTVAKEGCIFTTNGFCGTIEPFFDKFFCEESSGKCANDAEKCIGPECDTYKRMCGLQAEYCAKCTESDCDSNKWIMDLGES